MNSHEFLSHQSKVQVNEDGWLTLEAGGVILYQGFLGIDFVGLDGACDSSGRLAFSKRHNDASGTILEFQSQDSLFAVKRVCLRVNDQEVSLWAEVDGSMAKVNLVRWLGLRFGISSQTEAEVLHAPRFDWSKGLVHFSPKNDESLACQQWISPPPFSYGWKTPKGWVTTGLVAARGRWNFQSFDYRGATGPSFEVTYEGHLDIEGVFRTPELVWSLKPQIDEWTALELYSSHLNQRGMVVRRLASDRPLWWRQPLFCGWGEQRKQFRRQHDGHEFGNWINAGDLSTQTLYERCLERFAENGINPGIVVVDCFWSERLPFCEPDPFKWTDLRGFIDDQHRLGRKVLLWLTPISAEGLPVEACMTLEGRPVAADPTSPVFQRIFAEEIRKMISSEPGCLDADGFKIDFTQNCPAENQIFRSWHDNKWAIITEDPAKRYPPLGERTSLIRTHDGRWGVEIVRAYIEAVRGPLKAVKPEGLLVTHTGNPYFADVVDMFRLNDMDGVSPDVLGIMGGRTRIARACNPDWLIDTDNDLMVSREKWRDYVTLQPELGVPDTYYATGIAVSQEEFQEEDYRLLREVWADYRSRYGLPVPKSPAGVGS